MKWREKSLTWGCSSRSQSVGVARGPASLAYVINLSSLSSLTAAEATAGVAVAIRKLAHKIGVEVLARSASPAKGHGANSYAGNTGTMLFNMTLYVAMGT